MDRIYKIFVQKLLGRQPANILGIDIGSSSIKIAHIAFSGDTPLLLKAGIIDLPLTDADIDSATIASRLRQFLGLNGLADGQAVAAISSKDVYLQQTVLPQMPVAELKEAIKWEVEKYIPQAIDNYYFDFAALDTTSNPLQVKGLIVAARRQAVDNLVALIKGAGLRPVAVEIEPVVWQRTCKEVKNALVVDIGGRITQITLLQGGCPVVSRAIDLGGYTFTQVIASVLDLPYAEAERLKQRQPGLLPDIVRPVELSPLHRALLQTVEELTREIQRTVSFYQEQHAGMQIDQLLLAGGGAKLANLAEYLTYQLKIPVFKPNLLSAVNISAQLDESFVYTNSDLLAVAVGLGLRGATNDSD